MRYRPTKYPQLRQHQDLLSKSGFLNPPLESSLLKIPDLRPPLRNVVEVNAQYKTPKLCVRVCLGGKLIMLAYCSTSALVNAVRVADMATLFFWKYRLRGPASPPREVFNLSLEQATVDFEREAVHRDIFLAIEATLILARGLPTAEELTRQKQPAASTTSTRGICALMLSELRQSVITLRGENLGLTQKIDKLTEALVTLLKSK